MLFFTCEESQYADFLSDDSRCAKVAFLVEIFEKFNYLKKIMLGKKENILTSTDKISSFHQKLVYGLQKLKNTQQGI